MKIFTRGEIYVYLEETHILYFTFRNHPNKLFKLNAQIPTHLKKNLNILISSFLNTRSKVEDAIAILPNIRFN